MSKEVLGVMPYQCGKLMVCCTVDVKMSDPNSHLPGWTPDPAKCWLECTNRRCTLREHEHLAIARLLMNAPYSMSDADIIRAWFPKQRLNPEHLSEEQQKTWLEEEDAVRSKYENQKK